MLNLFFRQVDQRFLKNKVKKSVSPQKILLMLGWLSKNTTFELL
jgi:hypothetical protein